MADAALVLVAIAIGFSEEGTMSETATVLIFSCVFIGAALAVTPFIMDSVAARHEDLIEARRQLESLAQKLAESADIIGTVAGQLQELNDSTVKAIHMAETLPYKMQEKVGELAQLVQQGEDDEKEAMAAELEELRDSESRHFEAGIDKARATLEAAVKRVEAAEKSLAAATAEVAQARKAPVLVAPAVPAPSHSAPPAPAIVDEPAAKHVHKPKPAKETAPEHVPVEEAPPAPAAAEPVTNGHDSHKHRAPAKPVKHERHAPKSEAKPEPKEEASHEPEPSAGKEPVQKESPAQPPRKKPAPKPPSDEILPGLDPVVIRDDDIDGEEGAAAKTSDGSTRLLVTAYIGIGNKVFVRGDGPGLDPEKGQAMEFVSIGKWLWQTSDATAPVTVQLFKNDEVKAMGDDITIDPGHHVEVTPVFRDPNPF